MYERKRAALRREINVGCTEALEVERNSIIISRSSDVCQQDKKGALSRACDVTNPTISNCRFEELRCMQGFP